MSSHAETVSFESVSPRGWFIRHSSFVGVLTNFNSTPDASVLDRSALEKLDATFLIHRPGLSGTPGSVSFESANYPGYFLRHQNYRIKLLGDDGQDLFRLDTSFFWRDGKDALRKDPPGVVSLESVNLHGHYIRHQNHELWLAPPDAGNRETFTSDASFLPWPGLRPRGVETVSFQSVNKIDKYIRHTFFLGVLTQATNVLEKADATFIVRRPGLTGTPDAVSFESVNYPGYYLRHQNYRVKLQRDDGTDLFHIDASFVQRPSLTGQPNAVSLESVNLHGHYIRHQNHELWLAPPDAGNRDTFSGDASFLWLDGFVAEPLPCGIHRVGAAAGIPTGPVAVPTFISTERIGQLTGSTDPEGLATLNNTNEGEWWNAGVDGVDLGACVEHKDRLYIFFGDVAGAGTKVGTEREGADLVGWTADIALRPGGFTLHPVKKGPNQWFDPYSVSGEVLGLARTPSGAFSYRVAGKDTVFVFALWNDPSNPRSWAPTSVLTSKYDPAEPGAYKKEFTFSYLRFWSVVPIVVSNAKHPGLPSKEGDGLVLLAGGYKDAVHLAWMKLDPERGPLLSTVRYYTGTGNGWSEPSRVDEDTARANPALATEREEEAKTLVDLPPYFSSVSAAWLPCAQRWVLLYSTAVFEPHIPEQQRPTLPIVARFGANPWSWSNEVEVFNPCRDLAFGHYIHWTGLDDIDSRVPPPITVDRDAWALERGHAYGASVLKRFTTWEPSTQELTLAYLMSAFNPYQVQVMRTRLRLPEQ